MEEDAYSITSLIPKLKEIGKGTYATIYRYYSETYKKHLALKIFTIYEDSKREYEILAELKKIPDKSVRKMLPKVYFRSSNILAIEYIEGYTLETLFEYFLKHSDLSVDEEFYLYITKEMLKVLSFLHSIKIYHRDIKPENIMLRGIPEWYYLKPRIKLIDFGLATHYSEGKKIDTVVGSPIYMAPEAWTKFTNKSMIEKSDIWSLGITLVEFINKNHPIPLFTYKTIKHAKMILYDLIHKLDINMEISDKKLERCIKDMLITNYNERPSADSLLQFLGIE